MISRSLELYRRVVAEAQAVAPDADRAPLLLAIAEHANYRETAMAQEGVQTVGEVVIGPAGDVEGWTVVKWRDSCPPVGTVLYTVGDISQRKALMNEHAPELLKIADRFFSFYELHKDARGGQLGRDFEALRAQIMGEASHG